jgi:hypothetical protein
MHSNLFKGQIGALYWSHYSGETQLSKQEARRKGKYNSCSCCSHCGFPTSVTVAVVAASAAAVGVTFAIAVATSVAVSITVAVAVVSVERCCHHFCCCGCCP